MDWVFWLAIFFIGYTYFLYGALLQFVALFRNREVGRADHTPDITVIIPCYNEEKIVRRKIENTLHSDYPSEKMQVIVASDCSSDSSEEIVREYADQNVHLVRQQERKGKHFAQELALRQATGSIIVFTDMGLEVTRDGFSKLVSNFADKSIGCVSSKDKIISVDGDVSSEGIYIRYDMHLRLLESRVCSSTGMTGAFYAVRRELCDDWIPELSNDFYLPLKAVMKGFRTIVDQRVIGLYRASQVASKEYHRKVRTIVHGIDVVYRFKGILNPFRYGLFAVSVLSHKLFRWLIPFAAIAALVSNIFLLGDGLIYTITLAGQGLVYFIAAVAHLIPALTRISVFKIPTFLLSSNLAIFIAWFDWLRGERYYSWEPTQR